MTRLAVTTMLLAGLTLGGTAPAQAADWAVPDVDRLPDDKYGRLVRAGKALVEKTHQYIGPEVADPAKRYAGNNLSCSSCHVDGGTKKFGNPFVGTFADYPQYRPREDDIQTIEERINGCMERSMNGRPLPLDSREMKAMTAYMKFMSSGVPVGKEVAGRGMPKIDLIERAADPAKGREVYAQTCAACHGADGQGVRAGKPGDAAGYTFPPLWGADSYNNGAGMARVIMAARFIKYNMPKGISHDAPVLSDQQAFDVAAYINSQPRPEKANLMADFPARKNKPADAPFPPYRPGFSAEQHKYGPFKPIVQAREKELAAK
ncbi:MAG: c-type cytochrome [Pseudomonadota bacterium]